MHGKKRSHIVLAWVTIAVMLVSCMQLSFAATAGEEAPESTVVSEESLPAADSQSDGQAEEPAVSDQEQAPPSSDENTGDETQDEQEVTEEGQPDPAVDAATDEQEVQEPETPAGTDADQPAEEPQEELQEEPAAEESPEDEQDSGQDAEAAPAEQAPTLKAPAKAPGGPLRAPLTGTVPENQLVNMKSKGIKVNFFDYGPASIDNGWSNWTRSQNETGINAGKTLKFFSNGLGEQTGNCNGYNNWTGSPNYNNNKGATTNQGIVQNKLSGGYPVLAVGGGEDLKYLFDPKTSHANREDYVGVDGLFKKSKESGNSSASAYRIEYNCLDNYARLNESTKQFTLYNGTYYCEGQEASGPIGFFPFNDPDTSKTQVSGPNMNTGGGYYNHHFGMTMDAEFAITENGMLDGEDMTFNFAGDDDMWVFIDGVLVLDIGGIHQPVAASINFKNGKVSMHEAPIYDGQHGGAQLMSAVQKVGSSQDQNSGQERRQAADGRNSYYYDTNGT